MKQPLTAYIKPLLLTTLLLTGLAGCSSTPISKTTAQTPGSEKTGNTSAPPEAQNAFKRAKKAMKIQNYRKAEKLLVEIIQKYPNFSGPYANLGIIYARDGRDSEAEKQYKKAIKLNKNSPAIYNQLGILHRQNGRFDEAESAYKKALKLDENYTNAHINLGILYDLYMGNLKKALDHYKRYQELSTEKDKKAAIWILDLQRRIKSEMSKI
ncbi:MAG: tetratricopeptide repeat protein [Gammaproteobacteria bacterium]|nr:tetratricopeptide repeat protein [Gammaproteobacteria bacterium]